MTEKPQDRTGGNIFLARVFTVIADRVSAELGSFSGWMIAGYGAALGLLVANIETVTKYVSPKSMSYSIKLFLVAVVLKMLKRYMAAIIAGSVAVGKEVATIPPPNSLDLSYILSQMEQAIFWPTRIIVRRSNAKILAGDLARAGRMNLKIAQIQAWLVFFEVIALVAAAAVIAHALTG